MNDLYRLFLSELIIIKEQKLSTSCSLGFSVFKRNLDHLIKCNDKIKNTIKLLKFDSLFSTCAMYENLLLLSLIIG